MGGLLRKLPITALTMLVGCLAIAGAGIPFLMGFVGGEAWSGLGLSGFYSKDAILEQAYSFLRSNTSAWPGVFFLAGAAGAALTAFYMFRLWFMTFLGRPRDEHRHAHAHEAPPSMVVPLIILAVMAIGVAWDPGQGLLGAALATAVFLVWKLIRGLWAGSAQARWNWEWADLPLGLSVVVLAVSVLWSLTPLNTVVLRSLLLQAEPINAAAGATSPMLGWVWPSAHVIHEPANGMAIVVPVTLIAIGASLAGLILATLMYGLGRLDPDEVRRQFEPIYRFLRGKWWFDEVYDWLFVRPSLLIARCAAAIDRRWIDGIVDGSAWVVRVFSSIWDKIADQAVVDGLINLSASWTYAIGRAARKVQTGRVRQYVMSVVIAAVTIFILIALWNSTLAG
jgi:NADH-quinone oxidoreductase subunit L